MILTRQEFAEWWTTACPEHPATIVRDNHPLWCMENHLKIENVFFLCGTPIPRSCDAWRWGEKNLTSPAICYSSGDDEEWWGFKNMEDLTMWVLKWGT